MLRHTKTTYDGFSLVVDEMMKITEFDKIISSAQGRQKFNLLETIKLILIQRFDSPGSKSFVHSNVNQSTDFSKSTSSTSIDRWMQYKI